MVKNIERTTVGNKTLFNLMVDYINNHPGGLIATLYPRDNAGAEKGVTVIRAEPEVLVTMTEKGVERTPWIKIVVKAIYNTLNGESLICDGGYTADLLDQKPYLGT